MPSPETAEYLKQIQAIRSDAQDLVKDLSEEQVNWQPDPSKWSIAQNLDHLTQTVAVYPEKMHAMIGEARQREMAGKGAYREGFISKFIINGMEPPPKMRVKTSKFAEPRSDLRREKVIADFDDMHRRLEEVIVAADGAPLGHARMASPFAKIIAFTLGQTININLAHGRRHIWQARQVRNAMPASALHVRA